MDQIKSFKVMFKSIRDYRTIVLLIFLIQNDKDLSKICGFLKNNVHRSSLEFENFLSEQNEEHLDYIINEQESFIEKILNK